MRCSKEDKPSKTFNKILGLVHAFRSLFRTAKNLFKIRFMNNASGKSTMYMFEDDPSQTVTAEYYGATLILVGVSATSLIRICEH